MVAFFCAKYFLGGVEMAKGKYQYWLTPEGLIILKDWARNDLTDEQIAKNIGISAKTLYEWKNTYSEICNTLKENKDLADAQVENALFTNALIGDTTAQIFWLKNRRADKWREKYEVKAEVKDIFEELIKADEESERSS